MKKEITFWKDGEYVAKGGYFIRNNIKEFINTLIESGYEPIGIKIDIESYNVEVMVKSKLEDIQD
jgi:acyl CoA:acetate/3-ketoacid CoA transferase alpha subunit